MALVSFQNACAFKVTLSVRIGPVNQNPDNRGQSNTTIDPGDTAQYNVGDGDVWYCYGKQQVGGDENPQLCNGGANVVLNGNENCFVDN